MYFGNPKVKVYLEYIIYDFVATISAVGGTLGLCIGFSFTGVVSSLMEWSETLKRKIGGWKDSDLKVRHIRRRAGTNPLMAKHKSKIAPLEKRLLEIERKFRRAK